MKFLCNDCGNEVEGVTKLGLYSGSPCPGCGSSNTEVGYEYVNPSDEYLEATKELGKDTGGFFEVFIHDFREPVIEALMSFFGIDDKDLEGMELDTKPIMVLEMYDEEKG